MKPSRLAAVVFVAAFIAIQASQAHAIGIFGTNGDDHLFGTNSRDTISGWDGDDNVFGKKGNDRISGGPGTGRDFLFPGAGLDKAIGSANGGAIIDDDGIAGDILVGNDGAEQIFSLDGAKDNIRCGSSEDVVFADPSDKVALDCESLITFEIDDPTGDVVIGTNGADTLSGTVFATIFGLRGNDVLTGSNSGASFFPGHGADQVNGGTAADTVFDTDGKPDTINTGAGNDQIFAADGAIDTIICGGEAGDEVWADQNDNLTCPNATIHDGGNG